MAPDFIFDNRLGINVPSDFPSNKKRSIPMAEWEKERGKIPDRIAELEGLIRAKQRLMDNEENFETACIYNSDIAGLASVINDLWLWYRAAEPLAGKAHQ
ncbi:radical SAM protein [Metabacillus sp. KIGAM252]|uniref:Radical SAM protein n=1 Tax=Metabacillus flavus TaxID=2823519 RepID=A0ABS5LGY7_9BACI|nr:radical SAM protein [Metabacillus flavus]MBS2970005.1 radical SAM protein [Metabacillus flavus]